MKFFSIVICLFLFVRAEAEQKTHYIYFHSDIEEPSSLKPQGSVDDFVAEFQGKDVNSGDTLVINLHSVGGHTGVAHSLFSFLRWVSSKGAKIETVVESGRLCASACVMVFAAGDVRRAGKKSSFVFHPAFFENTEELNENELKEAILRTERAYFETLEWADINFAQIIRDQGYTESGEHEFSGEELFNMSSEFLVLED